MIKLKKENKSFLFLTVRVQHGQVCRTDDCYVMLLLEFFHYVLLLLLLVEDMSR